MTASPENPEQKHPSSLEYQGSVDDVETLTSFAEKYDLDPLAAERVKGKPVVNSFIDGYYESFTTDKPTGITVSAEGAAPRGLNFDPDAWQARGHLSEPLNATVGKEGAKLSTGISGDGEYFLARAEPYTISDQNRQVLLDAAGRKSILIAFPLKGEELGEAKERLHNELEEIPSELLNAHDDASITRDFIRQAIDETASNEITPQTIPEEAIKGSKGRSVEIQMPLSNRLANELEKLDKAYATAKHGKLPSDPQQAAQAILEATSRTREIDPPFGIPFNKEERAALQQKLEEMLTTSIRESREKDSLRLSFKEAHPNRVGGIRRGDLEAFAKKNGLKTPPRDTELKTDENIDQLLLEVQSKAEEAPTPAEAVESALEQEPPQEKGKKFWRKVGEKAVQALGQANVAAANISRQPAKVAERLEGWLQKSKEQETDSRRSKIKRGLAIAAGVGAIMTLATASSYLGVDIDPSNIGVSDALPTPDFPEASQGLEAPPTEEATPQGAEAQQEDSPSNVQEATAEAEPAFVEVDSIVEPGDNIWNLCREELVRRGIEHPTNAQIFEATQATLEYHGLSDEDAYGISPGKLKLIFPSSLFN